MSNLPAWKNVVSGGIPPDGSPLYYFSPAPTFGPGGGGGTVSYADTAGHAYTADYATNAGTANTANTANSANTAISASHALFANAAATAISASYAAYAALAQNSVSSSHAIYALLAENSVSSSYSPYAATASYVPLTYGPGISYDPSKPMAFSASLRSVNGIYPTNGNVATTLAGVETGNSQSLYLSSSGDITASLNEGAVWVISNDPTSSNNGRSFIYDVDDAGVGAWYELSSLDLATTDARYLKLDAANGPMQGNLDMGGFNITAGNLFGTSSWAEKAVTASHAMIATTASHAVTASYVNITGSGVIVNYNGSQIQLTGSAGGAALLISESAPGTKEQGTLWFNSNDGNTYLQYISPTGNTWIPAATSVGNAFSSSHATTAVTAVSASRAQTSSVSLFALSSSNSVTSSYALTVAPKSGFLWTAQMGDPSVVGGAVFNSAVYLNNGVGVRLTQNVVNQFGTVNFNAAGFDFTKDFRISVATYAGVATGGGTTGDGIWIGFGGTNTIDRQGNGQAFSWWSSTYAAGNPGQYIYYNGAIVYSATAELSATGVWVANTIESRRNTIGTRTLSIFTDGAFRGSYTGTQPFSGTFISIGASCGAAYSDQYVRYICFEYI